MKHLTEQDVANARKVLQDYALQMRDEKTFNELAKFTTDGNSLRFSTKIIEDIMNGEYQVYIKIFINNNEIDIKKEFSLFSKIEEIETIIADAIAERIRQDIIKSKDILKFLYVSQFKPKPQ